MSDFCQVELRLLAHLSSDPELLRIFTKPHTDVFSTMASQWLVSLLTLGPCLFSAACRIHWCANAVAPSPTHLLPLFRQLLCSLPAHSLQMLEQLCCHGNCANHIIHPLYFADRTLHGLFVMTLSSFWSIFCACAHSCFLHSFSPTSVR